MDVVKSLKFSHDDLLKPDQLEMRALKDSYGKLLYQAKVTVCSVADPGKVRTVVTEPQLAFKNN